MYSDKLPEACLTRLPSTGEVIMIEKGRKGYYPKPADLDDYEELVDDVNKSLGVTKAQEQAMFKGSLWGWETPVADPDNYDKDGKWIG